MDAAATSSAVAKQLASCNRASRDRAVRLLTSFLSASTPEEDLLKIWKGLFYCMWHSDKLPVQSELVNRLASLLLNLEVSTSVHYFDAFLVTIRREWSGIDHLRMDKFYLLIRRFVHHVFLLLSRNDWDDELLARLMGILSEKSLLSSDKCQAQGVNYHIAEIFLDEIMAFLPILPQVFAKFLRPFISVLESSPDKVLTGKIKRSIFARLSENGIKYLEHVKRGELDGDQVADEVRKVGKIALGLQLSPLFFESASSQHTLQGNRRLLFSLRDGFFKLEKDLETSGIKVSFSTENAAKEEELVDQKSGITEKFPNTTSTKKRKKQKKESSRDGKKSKLKNNVAADPSSGEVPPPLPSSSDAISFNDTFMANLQKQFEKVAAESGMGAGVDPISTPAVAVKRKKKSKSVDAQSSKPKSSTLGASSVSNGDRSVKKVRFSLKNNLVWKPHNPLPPQSLRLPPSATPRGSALKKRAASGAIKEATPPKVRKMKTKASSVKKARKNSKSISPAVKRLRKLQSLSI
ncbi:ribosomal RNA processing-like protein [Wolffia australiana]